MSMKKSSMTGFIFIYKKRKYDNKKITPNSGATSHMAGSKENMPYLSDAERKVSVRGSGKLTRKKQKNLPGNQKRGVKFHHVALTDTEIVI